MLIGTHTLLPVCLAMAADQCRISAGREPVFPKNTLWVIGLFGALPDLCTPHLSLEARYSSWSHTLVFLGGLIPLCLMLVAVFPKVCRWRLALACWLASALHLLCDAIAGGIPWLLPWSRAIIGDYYIPPSQWLYYDVGFVLLVWALAKIRGRAEVRAIAG